MNRTRLLPIGLIVLAILIIAQLLVPVSAQGIITTELTPANLPWDATLSPDGLTIYYTAIAEDGVPAVFSIPASGGTPMLLAQGDPFVMPFGIDVSSDGSTLYVSDPWMAGAAGNAIFALASDGSGSPTPVMGTWGTEPQGVTVLGDEIYFSGINLEAGEPALYKIAAAGADAPTVIAQGAPLIAPAGIAVADDGTVYVLDRLASGGKGSVFRVQNGTVDSIASDVRIGGQMPGVALTLDGSTLLASSLDSASGTAQALVINLSTMETSIFNDGIGTNTGAGGLHRAHESDNFAWADSDAPDRAGNGGGKVYLLGTSASPISGSGQ
jgi:DNA-binding beta-propeller fold protein YncE